ncbi:MAG: hypothetical protein BAJATHORv1_40233 [Candidatus Thorarchaeota archaeon]|nr:MAG: hypothetical protein BAJATHORv1_40233 [Candidatus Thorarchaeota archaeon]
MLHKSKSLFKNTYIRQSREMETLELMNPTTKREKAIVLCGLCVVFLIVVSIILFPSLSFVPESKELEWHHMYGGSEQDWAYSIQNTTDGGFILAGVSRSNDIAGCTNNGGDDIYILKLDMDGTIEWQSLYGGSGNDYAYEIFQANDGGFIIIGESDSTDFQGCINNGKMDSIVLKLDSAGEVDWARMYGGSQNDLFISIQELSDGSLILGGESGSNDIQGCSNNGMQDAYIAKLTSDGSLIWQELYGGESEDRALCVRQTFDNGFIVFGSSNSQNTASTNHGDYDFYTLKLNSTGNLTWQQMYGGNGREWGFTVLQTTDGGYIACGLSDSTNIVGCPALGEWDSYIIRIESDGELVWQKRYGGSSADLSYVIQSTEDGFILSGGSWSTDIENCTNHGERDFYIYKIDTFGELLWQTMYGGAGVDYASSFVQLNDGCIVVSGGSESTNLEGVQNHGAWDVYIMKLNIEKSGT